MGRPEYEPYAAAFRQGLIETGYVEGRNLLIERRWADGHYERFPVLARDLVRRQVAVIAAFMPSTPVAIAEAPRIPIVFVMGGDPVETGFVGSLGRPGGNVTGVTTLSGELGPKKLELLRELVPSATIVAALVNPTRADAETRSTDIQELPASSGYGFISCTPVVNATSIRSLPSWRNYEPMGS